MDNIKRTKIVATVGPATEIESKINSLIVEGANLFRFNLKYNTPQWHNQKIRLIRKLSKKLKIITGVIVDIPRKDFLLEINDFDYIALSYIKKAEEILVLKKRLLEKKICAGIIAKIENRSAIDNLSEIINESDAVMVARGDLGNEIPITELAFFQKSIIDLCRKNNKPVIVATQMLLSMTENKEPTRAEATDVANAVFDGTDALMLSEETALGKNPIESVKMMANIARYCENTEELRSIVISPTSLADSLIDAAAKIIKESKNYPISAVVVFTKSGESAKIISKYRLGIPIIAISDNQITLSRLCLSFGVIPFFRNFQELEFKIIDPIFEEIKDMYHFKSNQTIMVIHGSNWFQKGSNNQISLHKFK